jgi:ATP-binding cassette subfamily B protein
MIDALFFPSVTILVGASTLLTMWISGEKVIGGSLTVGNIAEFLIYINLLTWPIISLGWTSTLIQRAAASQARLNVLLAEKPDMTFPEESSSIEAADITFDKVTFVYPDTGIRALKNISFEIKAGQKIGIVGSTGSGKSTLATLIARMYDVTEGEIQIVGKSIQTYSEAALRGAIGYAPQDVFLFSDTISQNIAFGQADASTAEIEQAARNASIYQNIADFPEGFNTVVGERGVTLSGGQKQRISIARAWIRKPKLLVLDDVLSAVDTRTEEEILRNLKNFRNEHPETAVLVVAHRISCIQDSDMILVLEHGQIAEMGTHEALLQSGGYYARIYEKQITEETTAA